MSKVLGVTSADVVLVDGGGTNIGSVRYGVAAARRRCAADDRRGADPPSESRILPGVGAAGPAMHRTRRARSRRHPACAAPARARRLSRSATAVRVDRARHAALPRSDSRRGRASARDAVTRVPHMGWNRLAPTRPHAAARRSARGGLRLLRAQLRRAGRRLDRRRDRARRAPFQLLSQQDNFFGTQFHPERSAAVGSLLLKNFLTL